MLSLFMYVWLLYECPEYDANVLGNNSHSTLRIFMCFSIAAEVGEK